MNKTIQPRTYLKKKVKIFTVIQGGLFRILVIHDTLRKPKFNNLQR